MNTIFQLIFFLGTAFLAITVTVYVLAVSLLGRAVRLSSEEQVREEEERTKDIESRIKEIHKELDEAKAKNRIDVRKLTNDLQDLERKESQHKWKLRWIRIKPKLLTSGWGVLLPGFFFLTAITLSAFALYQSTIPNLDYQVRYLWFAIFAMVVGMFVVCLILKVIEGIAISSEETSFIREKDMLKSVFREIEEEKRPELRLDLGEYLPPLHLAADSESTFEFGVGLSKGNIANNPIVYFLAPKGFDFVEAQKGPRPTGRYKEMVSVKYELKNIRKPFYNLFIVKLKAPSKANTYTLIYELVCDGFDSGYNELDVVVEEGIQF